MDIIFITGACGVTSRSVARGLRRDLDRNIYLVGARIFENKYAQYEGIYDQTIILPKSNDAIYGEVVRSVLQKGDFQCALVIPEPEVLV